LRITAAVRWQYVILPLALGTGGAVSGGAVVVGAGAAVVAVDDGGGGAVVADGGGEAVVDVVVVVVGTVVEGVAVEVGVPVVLVCAPAGSATSQKAIKEAAATLATIARRITEFYDTDSYDVVPPTASDQRTHRT
jgi:hypothetical protein